MSETVVAREWPEIIAAIRAFFTDESNARTLVTYRSSVLVGTDRRYGSPTPVVRETTDSTALASIQRHLREIQTAGATLNPNSRFSVNDWRSLLTGGLTSVRAQTALDQMSPTAQMLMLTYLEQTRGVDWAPNFAGYYERSQVALTNGLAQLQILKSEITETRNANRTQRALEYETYVSSTDQLESQRSQCDLVERNLEIARDNLEAQRAYSAEAYDTYSQKFRCISIARARSEVQRPDIRFRRNEF